MSFLNNLVHGISNFIAQTGGGTTGGYVGSTTNSGNFQNNGNPGTTLNDIYATPQAPVAPVDTGGSTGGTGYTGGSTGGTTSDASIADALRAQAQDRIGQLNSIYNSLYGQIDQATAGQRDTLEKGFTNQLQGLQNAFEYAAPNLQRAFNARGTGDSSYALDAQDNASKTYASSVDQIHNDENSKLAQLGQFNNSEKLRYRANQDVMNSTNLGNLTSSYQVQNYLNQLNDYYVAANQAQGGYGPNSQFMNQVNSVAPSQNQGANQLQKQLTDLVNSSTSEFAKDQIAAGLINTNDKGTQDSNYWLNYYKNLTNGGGATS